MNVPILPEIGSVWIFRKSRIGSIYDDYSFIVIGRNDDRNLFTFFDNFGRISEGSYLYNVNDDFKALYNPSGFYVQ